MLRRSEVGVVKGRTKFLGLFLRQVRVLSLALTSWLVHHKFIVNGDQACHLYTIRRMKETIHKPVEGMTRSLASPLGRGGSSTGGRR